MLNDQKISSRGGMSPLAKSILTTLAFFDAQEIPLTLMEIKVYLTRFADRTCPPSFTAIQNILESELSPEIEFKDGFYFLQGRNKIPTVRKERYKTALRRFRKAKKFLYFLRFIPYLRAVAISGSLSFLNSKLTSDIDLFVITQKNRVWLVRMLVSLYFHILGERRHGSHIQNRFCLNHYISEDFTITRDKNLFTATAYVNVLPVLGEKYLVNFWRKNQWLEDFLHQPDFQEKDFFFKHHFSPLQKVLEVLLDLTLATFLNWLFGLYQKRRIRIQEDVTVSDEELSFHFSVRGQKILTRFRETMRHFSLGDGT